MQDNNFQEDLFGKGVPSRKPSRLRVLDGCVKQRYLPCVKVPTEYAVVALIVVLVLLTLSYALGVKVGKSSMLQMEALPGEVFSIDHEKNEAFPVVLDVNVKEQSSGSAYDVIGDDPQSNAPFEEERTVLEEELLVSDSTEQIGPVLHEISQPPAVSGGYIICLASFREEDKAKGLSNRLISSGINSNVSKKSDWYQVYAEGYSSMSEAAEAKEKLKRDFKDCYIRKI